MRVAFVANENNFSQLEVSCPEVRYSVFNLRLAMPFEEALHDLTMLLRLSASTLSRIACHDPRNQETLDLLACDIDVIAERLKLIGSEIPVADGAARHLHS